MAQRSSRKRRKARARARAKEGGRPKAQAASASAGGDAASGRYARSRQKDDAARAALEPLAPGERPRAVTVGAVAAGVLAVAQVVALVVGFDGDEPRKAILGVAGIAILIALAWGMWRARYWAVLGMQTILALAIVGSAIALISAQDVAAALLVLAILVPCGVLFWFLVKAMARIQMPERPGASRP